MLSSEATRTRASHFSCSYAVLPPCRRFVMLPRRAAPLGPLLSMHMSESRPDNYRYRASRAIKRAIPALDAPERGFVIIEAPSSNPRSASQMRRRRLRALPLPPPRLPPDPHAHAVHGLALPHERAVAY